MKRPTLNRNHIFTEIAGWADPDAVHELRGARYQQSGNTFDRNGDWIPPEGVDPSTIEEPEDTAATPEAVQSAILDEFIAKLYEPQEIEQLPWVSPTDDDGERPLVH